MATPAWFDDVRVLGALPDEELVEALRALGEEHAADRLDAALAEVPTHPADRFSVAPRVLEDRAFSHPAQVLGYLDPAPSVRGLRPIVPIDELSADQTLLGQRITIGLDGFQAADYPGGQSHRVLFHFAANNGVDAGERLHFHVSRRVDEDQPFLILAQPLFVGLTVGQEGVELRCRTLKVEDVRDQEMLSTFESEVSRLGLRLLPRRQPAAELSSDMAYLLTETVSRRIRPIVDFPVGLVLTPTARSAPLALGTYVAAQVPSGIVTGWDWEDWRYHPLSGQIVGSEDPRERFPLNYLVLTVDRHLPRPTRDRLGRTVRGGVERPHPAAPVDSFAQAPSGISGSRPVVVEESPDPCRGRPDPPTGALEDLQIRVRMDESGGRTRLTYTLHSEIEELDLFQREIAGPVFKGSPDSFQVDLAERMNKLGEGTDRDGERGLIAEEIERRLIGIGRKLYADLIPAEMQQAYRRFRRKVCTVQITSDEPWIPWELIKPYDRSGGQDPIDDDFFCCRFQLTRWLAGGKPAASEIRVEKLAVFNAGSVPGTVPLPSAAEEEELIVGLASDHPATEDASPPCATSGELLKLLEGGGLKLLHVIAHGELDAGRPDEASIVLVDRGRFSSDDLRGAQVTLERPLVYLNACLVGQQGWSLTGLGGWVRAWIDCGCGAFVGPQWSVRDDLTYEFAKAFYEALEQGKTFGQAGQVARKHVRGMDAASPVWLAPAIYAHPNGRLVL